MAKGSRQNPQQRIKGTGKQGVRHIPNYSQPNHHSQKNAFGKKGRGKFGF